MVDVKTYNVAVCGACLDKLGAFFQRNGSIDDGFLIRWAQLRLRSLEMEVLLLVRKTAGGKIVM